MNGLLASLSSSLFVILIIMQTPVFADDQLPTRGDINKTQILRVCADPNNMPFSNHAEQGFENKLAHILGDALNKQVEYTWWPQRRGFLRATLNSDRCDVVMGIPSQDGMALTTMPYYRSTYVLVYRSERKYDIGSLDHPLLKHLRIGVHLIGNNSPPPAIELAHRGIINNVVGYNIYGDYRLPNPPLELIKAVANGDIDVAIIWGPMAGYFAKHEPIDLTVVPLKSTSNVQLPFEFSISVGVRKGDEVLKKQVEAALLQKHDAIHMLLDEFKVPQVGFVHPVALSLRN